MKRATFGYDRFIIIYNRVSSLPAKKNRLPKMNVIFSETTTENTIFMFREKTISHILLRFHEPFFILFIGAPFE